MAEEYQTSLPLTEGDERGYVNTLILIRIVIVFALILSTAVFSFGTPSSGLIPLLKTLYYGVALYLAFILLRLFSRGAGKHLLFKVGQIVADGAFVTLLVYITGLYESFFNFLYIIVIILGSIEMYMVGGFVAGCVCSLFYTILVVLQYNGKISPPFGDPALTVPFQEVLTHILANDFGFLLGGVLAGYLGDELKRSRMQVEERETDIKALEDFNRKIIENISSGIITVDRGGKVTFINKTGLDILGISPSSAMGMVLKEVIPGFSFESVGSGREERNEKRFVRPDGTEIVLGFSISSLKEAKGTVAGKILIFQDLTKVKEMEERVKIADRLAVLGELASGLAHEVRNPLSSIAGSAQVLKDMIAQSGDERTLLEIIEKESRRLNNLIRDFLAFARPEVSFRDDVNLALACEEVVRAIEYSEKKREGVQIELSCEGEVRVRADEEKIRQVLWNLILNAVEAVPAGAGEVKVSLNIVGEKNGRYARITVEDNGPGINEEKMRRIYDPFYTTKEGGTGLGLSVSSRIIQMHGGFIKAENNRIGGATFHVFLPLDGKES